MEYVQIAMEKIVKKHEKYFKEFMITKKVYDASKKTIKTYENVIKNFKIYLELLLKRNKVFDNGEYVLYLRARHNTNLTIKYKFIVLNNYVSFLVKKQYLSKNIIEKPDLNVPNKKIPPTSKETYKKMLDSNIKYIYKLMIETIVHSGMRKNELLNLKVNEIVKYGELCGKGQRIRILYFNDYIFEKLQKWIKENNLKPNDYVFTSKKYKKPFHESTLNKVLREFDSTIHGLRKRFASNNSNVLSTFALKNILGHSSIETTELYVEENPDDILEKLNSNVSKIS